MKKYLVDGNNLIWKERSLINLQEKDKQAAREKLVYSFERFCDKKNNEVIIFYDGFESLAISTTKVRIRYSGNRTADEFLRNEITNTKNRRNLVVISSDLEIIRYAKACMCEVILSENFSKQLNQKSGPPDEEIKVRELQKSNEEFKKLFGA